jgi:hypothetical protein
VVLCEADGAARAARPAPCAARRARAPTPLSRLAPPTRREAQPRGAGTQRRHIPEYRHRAPGAHRRCRVRVRWAYAEQRRVQARPGRRPAAERPHRLLRRSCGRLRFAKSKLPYAPRPCAHVRALARASGRTGRVARAGCGRAPPAAEKVVGETSP